MEPLEHVVERVAPERVRPDGRSRAALQRRGLEETPVQERESAELSSRAFNAAALTTLVLGSVVSLSMTVFNPAYENNALLAIGLIALFSAIERAGLAWLSWPVLALVMAMPLGWRLPRAAAAKHPVADAGFFRGMWVSDEGQQIVRAALRAREPETLWLSTYAWFLDTLASPMVVAIVNKETSDKFGDLKKPESVVGTGPWMLERYDPGVKLVYVRNPNYFLPGQPANVALQGAAERGEYDRSRPPEYEPARQLQQVLFERGRARLGGAGCHDGQHGAERRRVVA